MTRPLPLDEAAEAFLDSALERVLEAWAEGIEVSIDVLIAERPDLRRELEDLIDLARAAAILKPRLTPRVPGYRLLREIGRGAMGIVYEAMQLGLDRRVALKVLPDTSSSSPTSRRRFLAEARSLAQLQHEHIVRVFDVVETSEHCAYAMELIEGGSYAERLRRQVASATNQTQSRDDIVEVCHVGIAIARALAALHARGLLHRDVKPSNILLRADGNALLSDFGLVDDGAHELTRSGQMLGTLSFAPPEQLRGDLRALGPASDVYALGATLHLALSGTVPYPGSSAVEVHASIEAQRREPLSRRGVSRDLETIVAKCLEPRSADRYQSAEALAKDLICLLQLRPISARPLGLSRRCWRRALRHRRTIAIASAAALLAVIGALLIMWRIWSEATAEERGKSEWRSAQRALLELHHKERSARAAEGRGYSLRDVPASIQSALVHYDRAIDWIPWHEGLRRERQVVELAGRALQDFSEHDIRSENPIALDKQQVPQELASDPISRGLYAYLLGDVESCRKAWDHLDLAPRTGRPFIDAATGQMLLANDQPERAFPRLVRAYDEWPEEGFLALAIADCAVRIGDRPVAARFLEVARDCGYESKAEQWIRGELLALEGRRAEAIDALDQVTWHRDFATQNHARAVFIRLLHEVGQHERALELLLARAEESRSLTPIASSLAQAAGAWWASLSREQRQIEVLRCWTVDASWPKLKRLARIRSSLRREIGNRSTGSGRDSSVVSQRPRWSMSTLPLEIPVLTASQRDLVRSLPPKVQEHLARLWQWTSLALGASDASSSLRAARFIVAGALPSLLCTALSILPSEASAQIAWQQHTLSTSPSSRALPAASSNPLDGGVLLYGGVVPGGELDDLWSWSGTSRTWTLLQASAGLSSRYAPTMCSAGSRGVILFGGQLRGSQSYPDSTWLWNGAAWQQVSTPIAPTGRSLPHMCYDSHRDVVVLFGGHDGNYRNDTWEWDGTTWSNRSPASGVVPSRRIAGAICYDPIRRQTLLFGGRDTGNHFDDTWAWDGSTWTRLNPVASPGPRRAHALAWDDARARAVLFGGDLEGVPFQDLWEWDGSNWHPQTTATPTAPLGRISPAFAFDSNSGSLLMFGGWRQSTSEMSDTWTLQSVARAQISDTGPGCAGIFGVPTLAGTPGTLPWIGTTLSVQIGSANPLPLILLGFQNPVIQGLLCRSDCTLRVLPEQFALLNAASGSAVWSMSIPNDSTILGASAYLQVASLQLPTGCLDALSNGLRVTIGTR